LNFNNREILFADEVEGRDASTCQISSKLANRCGDIAIFQDCGCRHLGFWKLQNFISKWDPKDQGA